MQGLEYVRLRRMRPKNRVLYKKIILTFLIRYADSERPPRSLLIQILDLRPDTTALAFIRISDQILVSAQVEARGVISLTLPLFQHGLDILLVQRRASKYASDARTRDASLLAAEIWLRC